jgi:light-harvesting complex I chlorophyll a/b binding protein 2/light-harvesting complex I chlorophyll a/b binding protein 4
VAGVVVRAAKPSWLPGSEAPAYLASADLPGNFGFDPLKLGEDPDALKWYVQAELQNGRWAMLGIAGIILPEAAGSVISWPGAGVSWLDAGKFEYFAPASALFGVQMFLFAWAEFRRYQDYVKPGSANQDPIFTSNSLPASGTPGYPGGIFDPFGYSKGDLATLKLKEIKNARLAMLAFAGCVVQSYTAGGTPLANLSAHLADPFGVNAFSSELARL